MSISGYASIVRDRAKVSIRPAAGRTFPEAYYSTVMVTTAPLGGTMTISMAMLLVADPAELLIATE